MFDKLKREGRMLKEKAIRDDLLIERDLLSDMQKHINNNLLVIKDDYMYKMDANTRSHFEMDMFDLITKISEEIDVYSDRLESVIDRMIHLIGEEK